MPATNIEKTTTLPRIGGDVPRVMTAEEYVTFPDRKNGYTYELVRGVLVVRDPGVSWAHSHVQGKLYRYLDEWMEKFGHGEVVVESQNASTTPSAPPPSPRAPGSTSPGSPARHWETCTRPSRCTGCRPAVRPDH